MKPNKIEDTKIYNISSSKLKNNTNNNSKFEKNIGQNRKR